MWWFRLADRLGMPVSEAKAATTATEFQAWKEYFRRELNGFHRTDHYLARVCYQLYLIMHMLGGKPKLREEDFFIKFEEVAKGPADKPREELDGYAKAMSLKRSVMAAFGVDVDNPKGQPEAAAAEPDHVVMAGERDPLPPAVREVLVRNKKRLLRDNRPKGK